MARENTNRSGAFAFLNAAWEIETETKSEKLLLIFLASKCHADGTCWHSYRSIEAYTGISRAQIARDLAFLRDLGVLEWKKGVANQFTQKPNVYQLNRERMQELATKGRQEREKKRLLWAGQGKSAQTHGEADQSVDAQTHLKAAQAHFEVAQTHLGVCLASPVSHNNTNRTVPNRTVPTEQYQGKLAERSISGGSISSGESSPENWNEEKGTLPEIEARSAAEAAYPLPHSAPPPPPPLNEYAESVGTYGVRIVIAGRAFSCWDAVLASPYLSEGPLWALTTIENRKERRKERRLYRFTKHAPNRDGRIWEYEPLGPLIVDAQEEAQSHAASAPA